MDSTFWIGIIIGATVSLGSSFAANIYTDNLRSYFFKRRQVRLSNQKTKELRTHRFVSGLRSGTPFILLAHQTRMHFVLRLFVLAAMDLIFLILLRLMPEAERVAHSYIFTAFQAAVILLFIGIIVSAYVSMVQNSRNVIKAIDFEQYEKDIREKWGDDAV